MVGARVQAHEAGHWTMLSEQSSECAAKAAQQGTDPRKRFGDVLHIEREPSDECTGASNRPAMIL